MGLTQSLLELIGFFFFYDTGRDDFKPLEQKLARNCPFSLVIHSEEILLCLSKDDSWVLN